MVTTRVGWAVAVDHDGYPFAVVRTVDGGRIWRTAGPPGLTGPRLAAAFHGTRDAWVTWSPRDRAAPSTYRTTNAGKS